MRSGPRWARSRDACAACSRVRTQSCRSCGSDETIGRPSPRISAPSRGRFLLAYFVFPLEQRCSIENGLAVTRQRFDNLVCKMANCGRFAASSRQGESFMRQAPSVHVRTASASASGRLGAPKRQGASARKGAQGLPRSRLPLISPPGGCRRRTASLPAWSSAARAASRPARSS